MTRASYHHGNLRQALIEAATDTIRIGGAHAVSLRALARELGVSHAAPARHFAHRDDLLAAVAAEGWKTLADRVGRAAASATGARARLLAMARAELSFTLENPGIATLMWHPELRDRAPTGTGDSGVLLAETRMAAIRAAQAEGWRRNEAAEVAFLSLAAGLAGIATVLADPPAAALVRPLDAGRVIDALIDRLLSD
jgi:AcrR family transcriptional regulator